jgi:Fe-S-cluster-containing dehydrogenase component
MPPLNGQRLAQSLSGLTDPIERRRALKLMAASFAMVGLSSCGESDDAETLVPAVIAPPGIVPGQPNFYATASLATGPALGVVVEHAMGRPIKVEGNPNHPSSLGATDVFAQAMVLDFYDPDRAAGILQNRDPSDQADLTTMLATARRRLAQTHGEGFRILSGSVYSPTLGMAIDTLLQLYPAGRRHQWDAVSREAIRAGTQLAYGQPLDLMVHPAQADVILAIDSDLLSSAPGHVRLARDFASRRNPTRGKMNRLYAIEPMPSLTGAAADHRFVTGPADLPRIVAGLAAGVLGRQMPSDLPPWTNPLVADLKAHRGRALVHVGPDQPAQLHALVHAMNDALAARGATLDLIAPVSHAPVDQAASMRDLLTDMQDGKVETLLILDLNAAYLVAGFVDALTRVRTSISISPMLDETAQATTWFVPQAHGFETWSDARAHDGTVTILQPQAMPLYGGWSPLALLSLFADATPVHPLDAVRQTWHGTLGNDEAWRGALASGVIDGTAMPIIDAKLHPEAAQAAAPQSPAGTQMLIRPDPHLWDGRFSNNAWLQELPRSFTKLVWDNPLLIAPALAQRLRLENGDEVRVRRGTTVLTLPVWMLPGLAEDAVVASMGFGRSVVGTVGAGTGWDVTRLRAATGPVAIERTGRHLRVASTEHHNPLESGPQDLVRRISLADFQSHAAAPPGQPSLYFKPQTEGIGWGMSIDLNSCVGCNACSVACQAENNIPTVGKDQVLRQREMHWLRIDRYWDGGANAPGTAFQPVLCMHCEEAPCEIVCPVGATMHDQEGLNVMVYNRCVGTRFCSNNCPYKVRRFNYFAYAKEDHRPDASWNPDVTVRARGVMEKCTFCIQRIAEARIESDRSNDPAIERRVVTACQAACPTQAFTFGDIHDPDSAVAMRKRSPLGYALLEEQSTRPRVTYEARVRNPNPAITET